MQRQSQRIGDVYVPVADRIGNDGLRLQRSNVFSVCLYRKELQPLHSNS